MRHYLDETGRIVTLDTGGLREIDPRVGPVMYVAQEKGEVLDPEAVLRAVLTPERLKADKIERHRAIRNAYLLQSDWTQAPDALLDKPAMKAAWADYRAQLRAFDLATDAWPKLQEGTDA